MTHENFIVEVARRLEWTEEKTSGFVEAMLEVLSAELKINNSVILDDFGILKTDIQPEYILVNPETKERYLMPPSIEVFFGSLYPEKEDDLLRYISFTPDEVLSVEVNSSFSQFEPTLLNEGVQFPGVPEIVFEEEVEGEEENVLSEQISQQEPELEVVDSEVESVAEVEEIVENAELEVDVAAVPVDMEPMERAVPANVKESPPFSRSSRRGLRSNKRTPSVWIPIAGGIAIVVASLFFFKVDGER